MTSAALAARTLTTCPHPWSVGALAPIGDNPQGCPLDIERSFATVALVAVATVDDVDLEWE